MLPDLKTRRRILKNVKERILKNHVNVGNIDYADWVEKFDRAEADLLSTADKEIFEAGVQQILAQLNTSHLMFYDKLPKHFPAPYTIGATLQPVKNAQDRIAWGFLDIFNNGPAQKAGIRAGELLLSLDGVPTVPPVLPVFAIGCKHRLGVADVHRENLREIEIPIPTAKPSVARPPIIAPDALTYWFPEPSIAVLRLTWFPGFAGIGFSRQLAKAMKSINRQSCRGLIVDLRGNLGGSLGFVSLASYLCSEKLPIGYSLTPKSLAKGYGNSVLPIVPFPNLATLSGVLQFWAKLARYSFKDKSVVLMTQGLGPQPFHGRIVILTNIWTSSAAEIAAAFAKEHNLATIIGTKTAGKVLSAASVKVGAGYWLRLPFLAWYSWPQQLIEGVGVSPDIKVEPDPELLACGLDPQLSKAIEVLRERLKVSAG